ncbi:MAG: TetR/AcrR family transcriptional regulator [Adhaeribacter sp.]|nr:TetR/AcrR family transcriptional regulator [Adhaeribacter sp.]
MQSHQIATGSSMTLKETIIQEAQILFKREGLDNLTEAYILNKLDISQATFREIFRSIPDLVNQVVEYDLAVQRHVHKGLLAQSPNAVVDIMHLLIDGINQVKEINPLYYLHLQQNYPAAWKIVMEHLYSYSYPQIHGIINKGILEGNFRQDINIQLVTKIIMEQLNMLLNPVLFPPDRFNLAEVFRSIFLYYLRGLCTDIGAKQAENFFAHNRI